MTNDDDDDDDSSNSNKSTCAKISPIRHCLYTGADRPYGEAVEIRELAQILILLLGHVSVEGLIVRQREA